MVGILSPLTHQVFPKPQSLKLPRSLASFLQMSVSTKLPPEVFRAPKYLIPWLRAVYAQRAALPLWGEGFLLLTVIYWSQRCLVYAVVTDKGHLSVVSVRKADMLRHRPTKWMTEKEKWTVINESRCTQIFFIVSRGVWEEIEQVAGNGMEWETRRKENKYINSRSRRKRK